MCAIIRFHRQIIFGIVGGAILGLAAGTTRILHQPLHRAVAAYGGALLIMFFLNHYSMIAGGGIGALTVGMVATQCWTTGKPHLLATGHSLELKIQRE